MKNSLARIFTLAVVVCLIAAPSFAVFSGTDVFLPSVGRKPGSLGSQWYTTMWIYNPNETTANVQIYLLERDIANTSALPNNISILPGDTVRFENAVWALFLKEVYGAIRVVSDSKVVVNSRIYSQTGAVRDSVGQFFAGIPAAFAISATQKTELLGVYQTQPIDTSDFRYNFGFVETTGNTASVRVTLKDETGTAISSRDYTLLGLEQKQKTFSTEFAGVNITNGRLTVEVTSGAGRVIAYGAAAANGSTDPSTFEMLFRDDLLASGSSAGVASVNGATGAVVINGTGTASIGTVGSTITVTGTGIAGVTAGAGLTGGGSSGTPSLSVPTSGITNAMIADASVTGPKLAAGSVDSTKIVTPLNLATTTSKTLDLVSNFNGGIHGATLRATNNNTTGGIAGYFQTAGGDGTVVIVGIGAGPLLKGFGPNGGDDEFRFTNNGTLLLYNGASNTIKLDAPTGVGTFKEITVTGHSNASIPIAYATISSAGNKYSGTSNVTSTWNSSSKQYIITITGVDYYYPNYVTTVTPVGDSPVIALSNSMSNKLLVILVNPAGTRISGDFSFVVFKP